MLTLSKKTDYALISLAYLAEHPGRMASARQIAGVSNLPLALLMQILKTLHQGGYWSVPVDPRAAIDWPSTWKR